MKHINLKNLNHIIDKVHLEVYSSSIKTAHSIKNNVDVFLTNELFPQLEMLFDEYDFRDKIVRFEQLSLSLTLNKWDDFNGLKSDIYNQLKEKLKSLIQPKILTENFEINDAIPEKQNMQQISFINNSGQIFLFFLENGYLPWFGKEEQISSLTQSETWVKSLDDLQFFKQLDHILLTSENATDRFIIQFPDEIITAYLQRKNLGIQAETSNVSKIIRYLDHEGRRIFLKLLIRMAHHDFSVISHSLDRLILTIQKAKNPVAERRTIEQLKKLFQRVLPGNDYRDSVLAKIDLLIKGKRWDSKSVRKIQKSEFDENSIIKQNQPKDESNPQQFNTDHSITHETTPFLEKNEDEIRVQNAGLILLHPFLKPFFSSCKITGKEGNLSPENFELAIQTLHFLATGNEDVFEGSLIFEKFLCGVPLKMPVQYKSLLSDSIKTEANDLLVEVVRYWPALKNTSADGLRQMFIQRDGKLIQEENKYRLIVERKAQDLLLEKLNWNISVIKLPWISNILFTEW